MSVRKLTLGGLIFLKAKKHILQLPSSTCSQSRLVVISWRNHKELICIAKSSKVQLVAEQIIFVCQQEMLKRINLFCVIRLKIKH